MIEEIFSEALEVALKAKEVVSAAYSSIIGGDFSSKTSSFTSASPPDINLDKFESQIIAYRDSTSGLLSKFKACKSKEVFTDEITKMAYEDDIDFLRKHSSLIKAMINNVNARANLTPAKKASFKAICGSCMEIFKGIEEIIGLYNSEHEVKDHLDHVYIAENWII